MLREIELQLTALHPAQMQVLRQAKRFNVVCCGRRWGKTVLGMDRLIHPALEGKPVAWFAPNYRLLTDVWRELNAALAPIITSTNQQEWRIELRGGGVVEMWSLDSTDSGRGRAYAVAVVDECAMVPDFAKAWQETIRPMLTDYIGEAWFLSTPKGFNYFKTLFDRGQDPEQTDWASWQMPSEGNPHIAPQEIESSKRDLTEDIFNQEYLALFVNSEGSVFRRVSEAATASFQVKPEIGHHYVIGCDWGRSNDFTVFMVLDIHEGAVVGIERSKHVDYALQCERLKALSELWQPQQIIAEQNGVGQPIIEQLTRDGLRIESFTMTNASKTQAIESLALAFERGDIHIPNDPVMIGELLAYQAERLPSGLMRYGARGGQHDDTVMALAMAWSAVSRQHRLVYPLPDDAIVIDDFRIPEHWPRAYGLDLRWGTASAIWGALDPESDVFYLYDEYSREAESAVHASEILARGDWIPGLIDPQANGRNQADGLALVHVYRCHTLALQSINNPLESGVMNLRERMNAGRLKVFASLLGFLEQRRLYRHDERDQIVNEHNSMMDAARCLIGGLARLRRRPSPCAPPPPPKRTTSERGWMA